MQKVAPKAAMRLQKVVTFDNPNMNKKYSVSQTVITTTIMSSPPNVGGSKSEKNGRKRRSLHDIEIVTTHPGGFSKAALMPLYRNGLLNSILEQYEEDKAKGTLPDFPSTPENVKKINTPAQLKQHYDDKNAKRAKANKDLSSDDIENELGDKVKTRKRRSWG